MIARFISVLALVGVLLAASPHPAEAQLDALTNVGSCVVTGFAAGATTIAVNTGCGATLPGTAFNVSVCNTTDYPYACRDANGAKDPNYEILRVTAGFGTDSFTVTRAQESTSDVAHNTGGKVYWVSTFTAKTITDINTALGATFAVTSTNSILTNETTAPSFTGLSVDSPTLVVDATNDRVGIGTTVPGAQFTLVGDSVSATIFMDTYNASAGSLYRYRRARGTVAAPRRVRSGDVLLNLQGWGAEAVDDSTNATFGTSAVTIRGIASTSFTSTDHQSALQIQTTATGSASAATAVTIDSTQILLATGVGITFPGSAAEMGGYSSGGSNGIQLYPKGLANKTLFLWAKGATTSDTAPDENQAAFRLFASTGANSAQGANYFNPVVTFGATDGTNMPRGFELGVEGNMSAGTFSENRFYLWQFNSTGGAGNTVFAVDQVTSPRQFRFPWPSSAEAGYMLRVGGANISTNADGIVGGLDVSPGVGGLGNYTKNDTNTRFFHHFQAKPEFNFGGSNANTTVAIANLDSTNTSLTGATIIPLRIAFGGTELSRISSAGVWKIGGTASRGTTEGTNMWRCFNATAPAGTLTNGADLYCSGGELLAMDSGGNVANLTAPFTTSVQGIVPASGGGTTNYLRADGTWAAPGSSSSGGATGDVQYSNGASGFAAEAAFNYTAASNDLVIPGTTVTEDFALAGDNQPAQIAAATNDYALSATASVTVVDADQTRVITGMTGGADGRMMTLINDGASDSVLILRREDTGSTAANRFAMNADAVLDPSESAVFWYDSTASRWRLISTTESEDTRRRYLPFYDTDFLGGATAGTLEASLPWDLGLISTGTQAKVAGDGVRRGILRCVSSTTTNSGCQVTGDLTAYRIAGGEFAEYIIKVDTLTTSTFRFGYLDTATSTDAVDGVYIEVPSTGAAVCKTSNNSTRTTSATIATLSTATWYRLRIDVDNTAANATCTIFDANGNSLGSQTNSANIPTTAGRETGQGYVLTNSGTTAVNLAQVDYMSVGTKRAIVR